MMTMITVRSLLLCHSVLLGLCMALVAIGVAGCDRSEPSPASTLVTPPPSSTSSASPAAPPTARPVAPPVDPPVAPTAADSTGSLGPFDPNAPARISFVTRSIDLGKVQEIEKQSTRYIFSNSGGKTLVIKNIKASCGCTTPKPNKTEYAPGEGGHIDVSFEPAGPGRDPKYIDVITNAEPSPIVQLVLWADVQPFMKIDPGFMELGVLDYRKPHVRTVTVHCDDPGFTIEKITTTNPNISARMIDAPPAAPLGAAPGGSAVGVTKSIELTIAPSATWGQFFSWLEITGRGRPAPDKLPIVHTSKIRVQAQMFGRLRAEPNAFMFGTLPNQAFERRLKLRHVDGQPFTVTIGKVSVPALQNPSVRMEQQSPGEYELIFKAHAGPSLGRADGTVAITTNIPGEETLLLSIQGVIRVDVPGVSSGL